jgi:hypothetical protein
MNEAGQMNQAAGSMLGNYGADKVSISSRNTTVGENIDNRITQLREQIKRLESVKDKPATGTILDVSLEDLGSAMGRY